jgi:hypothetical protein
MTTRVNTESGVLTLDHNGKSDYLPEALRGYIEAPKQRRKWQRQVKTLYYPTPCGYNDPLSVVCVVDFLMRVNPAETIRAKYVCDLLTVLNPQLVWNAVTVGQILAEISLLATESFRDPDQRALVRTRDWQGNRWHINATASAWKWLTLLRDHAGKLAETQIKAVAEGKEVRRNGSVWVDLPVRDE